MSSTDWLMLVLVVVCLGWGFALWRALMDFGDTISNAYRTDAESYIQEIERLTKEVISEREEKANYRKLYYDNQKR